MLKKLTAFALAAALVFPMGFAGLAGFTGLGGEAAAATALNALPREPRFTSSSSVSRPSATGGVTSVTYLKDSVSVVGTKYTAPGFMPPDVKGGYAAWAYAAVAALNQKGGKNFDITAMNPGVNGSRSTLSAYLMDVAKNGPVELGLPNKTPVEGVVYLPDPASRADQDFIYNLQHAVLDGGGAAVASLFYDDNRYYTDNATGEDLYHNTATAAANHTVTVIGWDDSKTGTYTRVPDSGAPTTFTLDKPGAFLVHDDNHNHFMNYWVSYETMLGGAYYIEGFYDNNGESGIADFMPVTDRKYKDSVKNPLAYTYQYDAGGLNSVVTAAASKIAFANVFDVKEGAIALQAVSVFLTGENNKVDIYLVDDYEEEKDIKYSDVLSLTPIASIGSGDEKLLPGYYTLKLNSTVSDEARKLKGKRFALVAVVEYEPITGSGIPTSSSASANSFIIRDASASTASWSKSNAAVCLKGHAEKDVDIALTGVEITGSKDDSGVPLTYDTVPALDLAYGNIASGKPLLKAAPGGNYTVGPARIPANANNLLITKTVWTALLPDYERDANGWLLGAEEVDGVWEVPEPTAFVEMTWNTSFQLFIPSSVTAASKPTATGANAWAQNKAIVKDGDTTTYPVVGNYIEQPFWINGATSGAAKLMVSKDVGNYDKDFRLTVTAESGKRDDSTGEYVSTNGTTTAEKDADIDRTETAVAVVRIDAGKVDKIELNRTSHTMKANATVTLSAKQLDSADKPVQGARKVKWYVLDRPGFTDADGDLDADGNPWGYRAYDPQNPYNPNGPVAYVDDNGKVKALRDGICYVYATVGEGNDLIYSEEPCEITVTEVAPTGISINKKKMTMSTGTNLTLTASVKPSSSSNKYVEWKVSEEKDRQGNPVSPGTILKVELNTGVMTAGDDTEGTAVVSAVNSRGDEAKCVVTVTKAPSASIRKGKSATFSVLGAASNAKVVWEGITEANESFSGAKSGATKYRVTAKTPGDAVTRLTATVYEKLDGPVEIGGETVTEVPTRVQSWDLVSVVALSKMAFAKVADDLSDAEKLQKPLAKADIVKKDILCVSSDGSVPPQSVILGVAVQKPLDGTLLDFDWTVKKDKSGEAVAEIEQVDKQVIKVTALKQGTARITGVNYNSKKKINISIKVLFYPTESQIVTRSDSLTVEEGKRGNVRPKITGSNVNKAVTYELGEGAEEYVTLEEKKGKQTGRLLAKKATEEGKPVTVIIKAAGGARKTIEVTVKERRK